MNPYLVVNELENRLADWCGAPYCVAVESGTAAIFLSLIYRKQNGIGETKSWNTVSIPSQTYPSVPCSIIHAGFKVEFSNKKWDGEYELYPLKIYDAALRFRKGMYHGGLQCLSGHIKKNFAVGRAGFILTDSKDAYKWFKLARFDGREPIPLQQQKKFTVLGYNMYLSPPDAARAIQLLEVIKQKYPNGMDDLKVEDQKYADLSKFPIYAT